MVLKCGNWIDLCLLIYESLWFFIFLDDWKGYLVWSSSSIDSPSMIFGSSMNLYSGCILAVALPSVCGQVIYVVLVSCLMGPGLAALNGWHVDVISLLICCYVKVIFAGMHPYVLFGVNFYPPRSRALIYCAVAIFFSPVISNGSDMNRFSLSFMNSKWFLVAVRLLKLAGCPKYETSCYQGL